MEEENIQKNEAEEPEEDLPVEEIAEEADIKIEALIELLIQKGVITEEEFQKKYDEFYEEEEPSKQ
jgi:hypothetical protein